MEINATKEINKEMMLDDIRRQADVRASAKAALRGAGILIDISDNRDPIDIAAQFGLLHESE